MCDWLLALKYTYMLRQNLPRGVQFTVLGLGVKSPMRPPRALLCVRFNSQFNVDFPFVTEFLTTSNAYAVCTTKNVS